MTAAAPRSLPVAAAGWQPTNGLREARLVFLTAGGPGADPEILRLLQGSLNWDAVGWIAQRENAAVALLRRLDSIAASKVPPGFRKRLQQRALVTEFRQRYLGQRLEEAAAILTDAGMDVLLLKGAALVHTMYGGAYEARPMGDLDLLVWPEQATEAQRLLKDHGWMPAGGANPDEYYEGHSHLPPLDDARGTGIGLEVHTDLFAAGHPFLITPDQVWAAAQRITIGSVEVMVPSTVHQLLHNCLHFAWSHVMRRGAWRCFGDASALCGRMDWADFVARAAAVRGATCCYWTLRLARRLSAADVPDHVLSTLAPPMGTAIRRLLEKHFVAGLLPAPYSCPSVRVGARLWTAAVRPGLSGHGGVRPWERDRQSREATGTAPGKGSALPGHTSRWRMWRNYMALLGGNAT